MKNRLFADSFSPEEVSYNNCMLVVVSGYESRSTYLAHLIHNRDALHKFAKILVLGFAGHKDNPRRIENDIWYKSVGQSIVQLTSDHSDEALKLIVKSANELIEKSPDKSVRVHLDYSSMPRSWYCNIARTLPNSLRLLDCLSMWYCHGNYQEAQLPTAGVDDFVRYAGKPSLAANTRTHILGIGFDFVRSSAIKTVLDPQEMIVFYGVSDSFPEYRERALKENWNLIENASTVVALPTDDFVGSYGQLNYIVRDTLRGGDVILVPDGPKPLVLAASLISFEYGRPGVVSIHVKRRKDKGGGCFEVAGRGDPVAFDLFGIR